MIPVPSGVRVWLSVGKTDMRRGMNGLALLVQETLGRDPFAGDLFVFRGQRGDLVKILWHDGLGLSLFVEPSYFWKDPHSGQAKNTYKLETQLMLQKNFLDDTLIWVGNGGIEATYAVRKPIADLPTNFDWPTKPEMEIELSAKTGLSYRFAPNWFVGGEVVYQTEFETEVGQERWSVFAGPSLHYGGKQWSATLTWLPQIAGGGETYPGQPENLHLIEKTKQEIRFKLGYNF